MTQDERWNTRYEEVKAFIEGNKRRPSKYTPDERNAWNWLRHTQKQYASRLKPERVELRRYSIVSKEYLEARGKLDEETHKSKKPSQ